MTNTKVSPNELLTDERVLWESIISKAAVTFRMSEDETAVLRENKLVRMFALLPYFANCPKHEVVGLLNVSIYITERTGGKDIFVHSEEDDFDYLQRFKALRDVMAGGDEEVIDKGLALAGLVMLNDYLKDRDDDADMGKYNPLNSGSWDYDTAWSNLEQRANTPKAARLNSVLAMSVILRMWCWVR